MFMYHIMQVDPGTKIAEIKATVASRSKLEVEMLRIFLDGRNLEDTMTIQQCSVTDGSNLPVISIDNNTPSPRDGHVRIYVKYDDTLETIDVKPDDTISTMKRLL